MLFSKLSRDGFEYKEHERQLVLYTTTYGERISIQYPGKETKETGKKYRPWDFRPKLLLPSGEYMKDLTFFEIWDDIEGLHNANKELLIKLAIIFYRMALMIDHKEETDEYDFIDYNTKSETPSEINKGKLSFNWYKYKPDISAIIEFCNADLFIRGASLESYLYYNDLLAQNEDCKYYFRSKQDFWSNPWNPNIGRRNTFYTHLSIVEYIKGDIHLSELLKRFGCRDSVAPIPLERLKNLTNNIICRN